ncbi:unnamed protein product [Meganyctiphanes norvegica]|uniref:Uncharacterized protein n=1 Tax=Meganyctiphanes norvegica TaxID=48144 RepID=A0AAV2SEJ1_MEGNR
MAATKKDPRIFFTLGNSQQFEYIVDLYEEAVKLKAESKNKNPEDCLKLDRWYQNELPKKIKSRGTDAHLIYDEMCKCMKWKLQRGKFSPRFRDLIQMNTPRLCMAETKKAFRAIMKKEDLASAVAALCNLKGVGPAMASTILTAGVPDHCGFMADECMMAIPEIESIDYTTKELLKYVEQLRKAAERLNSQGGSFKWNAHQVEKALWAYFVLKDFKSDLLNDMPAFDDASLPTENGDSTEHVKEKNGAAHTPEESNDSIDSAMANKENLTSNTNGTSDVEDSRASIISNCEDTNDSLAVSEAPSEPVSEAPSETVSEASEDRPSSTTTPTPIPEATLQTDDLEPAQKKIKLDE